MVAQTIAEKIFDNHIKDEVAPGLYALSLQRILCHEVTTPQAITDLEEKGLDKVFDPTCIKATVDHVSPPKDLDTAGQYLILKNWCKRHNITFYDLGRNGVCHALFAEKGYARPGDTIICGDSHTCTLGAFGAFAAGVGTTYLETGLLTGVTFFKRPETIRFNLTGKLENGVFAKDLILWIIAKHGVQYATNTAVEFSGPGVSTIDMEGRMTISNMVVEFGGTTGIFPPDEQTLHYLKYRPLGIDENNPDVTTYRNELLVKDDKAILENWRRFSSDDRAPFKAVHDIDLKTIEPMVTDLAPLPKDDKPDLGKPVSELEGSNIDSVFIGSCTNGRISDLRTAAEILKHGPIDPSVTLLIAPATPEIFRLCNEEGLIEVFLSAGATVDSPGCSACLGMKSVIPPGYVCGSTSNRNFPGRMGKDARVQLMSPATAAASALKGKITDPREYLS
jgi:3-isopropylmalate/(R)-2-methylmalate dehydratase large subunit